MRVRPGASLPQAHPRGGNGDCREGFTRPPALQAPPCPACIALRGRARPRPLRRRHPALPAPPLLPARPRCNLLPAEEATHSTRPGPPSRSGDQQHARPTSGARAGPGQPVAFPCSTRRGPLGRTSLVWTRRHKPLLRRPNRACGRSCARVCRALPDALARRQGRAGRAGQGRAGQPPWRQEAWRNASRLYEASPAEGGAAAQVVQRAMRGSARNRTRNKSNTSSDARVTPRPPRPPRRYRRRQENPPPPRPLHPPPRLQRACEHALRHGTCASARFSPHSVPPSTAGCSS